MDELEEVGQQMMNSGEMVQWMKLKKILKNWPSILKEVK